MRLTKYGHACVRIEDGDRVLVIDPGTLSDPESLRGATAVLITHEHDDHIDVEQLRAARDRNPALTVHTHAALASALGDGAIPVAAGDTFSAGGFTVRAVGGEHAGVVDDLPGCPNLGFIVDGIYHPGDSLFVPAEADAVETLLVPASGPWLKLGEAIGFVRAVGPARAFPIHDAHLNEIGLETFDWWVETKGGAEYARIPLGGSVDLAQ
ncbi:L-ascorbate metabolism protein UlaG (beta-lactamase superfamily) [Kitasatospora sp. MAP12-15]|uniref:MBL fold metallo-hydrolase n=1 Tax=unclassified Kitasatospora TaxID=2633591 RepID=UPI00247469D4|nr:MBL fold metallo-hydrolase [Kitasatospora sp. MAP12-44]MDH6113414.1 L-ascorbate metabolism protein UlaG (beta-lactamase superfamily) [Kitasatospora sp. MAP12-44]